MKVDRVNPTYVWSVLVVPATFAVAVVYIAGEVMRPFGYFRLSVKVHLKKRVDLERLLIRDFVPVFSQEAPIRQRVLVSLEIRLVCVCIV